MPLFPGKAVDRQAETLAVDRQTCRRAGSSLTQPPDSLSGEMAVRVSALRVGELKPLSRGGLLLLAARCAMRVEPWMPPGTTTLWRKGLTFVAAAAFSAPTHSRDAAKLERELSDRGADACNRLDATDEPLGQCMNYATSTLGAAVEATALDMGAPLKKAVLDAAMLSKSIGAVLAHAGRVRGRLPRGLDAVDVAVLAFWDAIRTDIPVIAARTGELETAKDRVEALRKLAPLWTGRPPGWLHRR
jgi:hypothetical protein